MTVGQRVNYGLVAALLADVLVAFVAFLLPPSTPLHPFWAFLGFAFLMLVGVVPGMLVFTLLILITGELRPWKVLPFTTAGFLIGPILANVFHPREMLHLFALLVRLDPTQLLPAAISVCTTLLYVTFVGAPRPKSHPTPLT